MLRHAPWYLSLMSQSIAAIPGCNGAIKCSKKVVCFLSIQQVAPSVTKDLFLHNRLLLSHRFHRPGSYDLLIGKVFSSAGLCGINMEVLEMCL